jgi:pyruvate formate lyase activating enzyme
MGLVDGPGIRTVVFLAGCRLRCRYCHNPDSWQEKNGELFSPEQLTAKLKRFASYYRASGGGVTFSGGEPLLQPEFLLETLTLCKAAGIHTCLDTAGFSDTDDALLRKILAQTDLILYDVKHESPDEYRALTGQPIETTRHFLSLAQEMDVPLWIRHVVVPGLTDGEAHLSALKAYIGRLQNLQKVELLPYHTLGVHKYEHMGLPYSLSGVPPMDAERCKQLQQKIFEK